MSYTCRGSAYKLLVETHRREKDTKNKSFQLTKFYV